MGEASDSAGEAYSQSETTIEAIKAEQNRGNNNLKPFSLKRKQGNDDAQGGKRARRDKSKFKQPTPDELNNFREVENLYNSYILKSELEDLLLSNTYNDTKRTDKSNAFDKWFSELVNALKCIQEYENIKPSEFIKLQDKNKKKMRPVQLFINDTVAFTESYTVCDDNTMSSFVRPESVHSFGGFKSGACLKADFIPSVLVKMPRSAFYAKDFLNNRYWIKRFHYMLYLSHELKHKPFINQMEFTNYQDNELLKILCITPSYDLHARIQLFVVPEEDTFKMSRMEPALNNFKVNVFENIGDRFSLGFSLGRFFKTLDISKFATKSTAIYNTHLLHDFTLEENNKNIDKTLIELPSCQDAIKLLVLWLKKRQLNQNYTSFTNELLIYTIVYLVKTKKISKHMSSYQVARIFFIFISETDWRIKPISLSSVKEFETFQNNFDVVFTDYSGYYNLAGFLDADVYGKLKLEAAMALEILNKDVFRAFISLFKANMSTVLQYDCIVYFNDEDSFKVLYDDFISDEVKWKYFGFYEQLITSKLTELLKYGLGERVRYIVPLHLKAKNGPSNRKVVNSHGGSMQRVIFGLKLNPEKALNPLIIGPQQYDPEAAKFKEFWGDLVSLRRFANTEIHEAVFFDQMKTVADKRNICVKIVEFIANKVNIIAEVVSNQFEEVVRLPHVDLPFHHGTNEEATKLVHVATEEFFKKVKELTLPDVTIQMVQCVSDVICGTDPFPPVAMRYSSGKKITALQGNNIQLRVHKNTTVSPRYVPFIECVMQINFLDKSCFDSFRLYHAAVASVYDNISDALTATTPFNSLLTKRTRTHVDVLFKGLVFRLRAFNDREVALLKKGMDDNGQVFYRTNAESVMADKKGNVEGAVYGALNGLYRQFPCFGIATAIAKRWLRSQLLHQAHINDMTINLLMASIFLSPEPFDRPTLPQTAFLQFLRLLAEFPFDQLPVVLNFNGELNNEDVARVEGEFIEKREHYNSVHILMLYDREKSVFTAKSPDNMIVRRLKNIAIDSLRSLNECVLEQETIFPEHFFVPNLEGYDVIIQLYSTLNPNRYLKAFYKTDKPMVIKAYVENEDTKFPIVAYSPIDIYLQILEETFGSYAYFFHDMYGGNFIGVVWNIRAREIKDFKVSNVPGRYLVGENKVSFSIETALQDFVTLAGGLVKDIVENNNNVEN